MGERSDTVADLSDAGIVVWPGLPLNEIDHALRVSLRRGERRGEHPKNGLLVCQLQLSDERLCDPLELCRVGRPSLSPTEDREYRQSKYNDTDRSHNQCSLRVAEYKPLSLKKQ
uniref:Uncharacterized protein n=1 Tax=uncultured Acetothermia bacterium TaxID=236499 RepID=H5SEV9_9BACT|nr:hypothetical protein HGMM_F17E10C25 [uncultured Acetothermia bacterium]